MFQREGFRVKHDTRQDAVDTRQDAVEAEADTRQDAVDTRQNAVEAVDTRPMPAYRYCRDARVWRSSPTLSPTDPVPRGLLTLCPGAF